MPRGRPDPGYTIDAVTGCWNWNGHIGENGYTGFVKGPGGRPMKAYAAFYVRVNGPVPDGLELDHACYNPRCVNPDHLEAVTHAVNARRRRTTKLTEADVASIRSSLESHAALATKLDVSARSIRSIRAGLKWKGVLADGTTRYAKLNGGRPAFKLTVDKVIEIQNLKGTATQLQIAQRFGISRSMVSILWSGKSWSTKVRAFLEVQQGLSGAVDPVLTARSGEASADPVDSDARALPDAVPDKELTGVPL